MRDTRVYLDLELCEGAALTLPEPVFRHLVQVLRMQAGERFTAFNGRGGEFEAAIEQIGKRSAQLRIGAALPVSRESPLNTTLAQGISKGDRMDYALQKATELGVTRIVPLITERCNLRMDGERWDKKIEHWRGVIESACEQSGRTRLPQLMPVQTLETWCAARERKFCGLLFDPRAEQGLASLSPQQDGYEVLVGPEGGLGSKDLALAAEAGFITLHLGPRILRTETAGPAVIAALQARFGDLG